MDWNFTGLMTDNGYPYPSDVQLHNIFAASCVESVAARLHITATEAYLRMKRVELFRDFIFPCYDTLHSQSREVVTDDVIAALENREKRLDNHQNL